MLIIQERTVIHNQERGGCEKHQPHCYAIKDNQADYEYAKTCLTSG